MAAAPLPETGLDLLTAKCYHFLEGTQILNDDLQLTGEENGDILSALCADHVCEVGVIRDLALNFLRPQVSETASATVLERQHASIEVLKNALWTLMTTRRNRVIPGHRERAPTDAAEANSLRINEELTLKPSPRAMSSGAGATPWVGRRSCDQ